MVVTAVTVVTVAVVGNRLETLLMDGRVDRHQTDKFQLNVGSKEFPPSADSCGFFPVFITKKRQAARSTFLWSPLPCSCTLEDNPTACILTGYELHTLRVPLIF